MCAEDRVERRAPRREVDRPHRAEHDLQRHQRPVGAAPRPEQAGEFLRLGPPGNRHHGREQADDLDDVQSDRHEPPRRGPAAQARREKQQPRGDETQDPDGQNQIRGCREAGSVSKRSERADTQDGEEVSCQQPEEQLRGGAGGRVARVVVGHVQLSLDLSSTVVNLGSAKVRSRAPRATSTRARASLSWSAGSALCARRRGSRAECVR